MYCWEEPSVNNTVHENIIVLKKFQIPRNFDEL
jgi:hypothetical protein